MTTAYPKANSKDGRGARALVSFRIVLPLDTTPQTVHLLGSWDNYRTASAMEQDIRVGRGVWKYMITDQGGLEMGCEYTYYFLLDSKRCIPDPSSSPELTTADPRTGRLASILYVPLELPPSPVKPPPPPPHVYLPPQVTSPTSPLDDKEKVISPVSVIRSSVFAGSGDDGGRAYEEPRKVPEHPTHSTHSRTNSGAELTWNPGSFKGRIRASSVRRVSSMFFGGEIDASTTEETSVKRKWSLVKKTSGFFRSRSKARVDDGDKKPRMVDYREMRAGEAIPVGLQGDIPSNKKVSVPSEPELNISDIVGYLREEISPGLAHDISHRPEPARAYYHSPVAMNTYISPLPGPQPEIPRTTSDASKELTEIANASPSPSHSLTSSCSCNDGSACSPMVHSAFSPEESCSSDGEDEEDETYEVETPVDGLGITTSYQPSERVYPKYYNFDEISGVPGGNRDIGKYAGDVILSEASYVGISGGPKPLACLREEVAGELAWRDELVDELGYLREVVV